MSPMSVPHLQRLRVRGQDRLRVRERGILPLSTLNLAELCTRGSGNAGQDLEAQAAQRGAPEAETGLALQASSSQGLARVRRAGDLHWGSGEQ